MSTGQFGPIQVSTAAVVGGDILTPEPPYITIFAQVNPLILTQHLFFCKDSDGNVDQIMAGAVPVTCDTAAV